MTARNNRKVLIAKIHIARKDLGLDEETYRDVLQRVTGSRSAANCEATHLERAITEFKRLGWKPSTKKPASKSPRVRKVWALWGEMCRQGLVRAEGQTAQRAALRAFCERMTGVTDPEWLTLAQASQVIEGLKHWKARGAA